MYLMIDIETLSTKKDAAVMTIGMAWFNGDQITATTEIRIDPRAVTGTIDASTVAWWSSQSDEAREAVFGGKLSEDQAKLEFRDFVRKWEAEEVWANSPSFDLTILNSWWYRGTRPCEWPLHFRNERDCRTYFALGREMGIEFAQAWEAGSVAHNALDDACNQARAIILIREGLHQNRKAYDRMTLR